MGNMYKFAERKGAGVIKIDGKSGGMISYRREKRKLHHNAARYHAEERWSYENPE